MKLQVIVAGAGPVGLTCALKPRALQTPDVRARLEDTGMTITALRGPPFVAFIQADIRKWTPVVRAAKLDQGGK